MIACVTILTAGCDILPIPIPDAVAKRVAVGYDFRNGANGWEAGFADYAVADEEAAALVSGLMDLPATIDSLGTGFFVSGNNTSADLFMFLKRSLGTADGIVAGQSYRVRFKIVFASNAPRDCLGVGGSAGESVFLKVGASGDEPVAVEGDDGVLRMNVDIGDQSTDGVAASVAGNIANGVDCEVLSNSVVPYRSIVRSHTHETLVTADADGVLWLLVGTDSGFEGTTALYYGSISAELTPVDE